jgi:hypothetical protein
MPYLSTLLNSSSASIFLNNFASSSYLRLCSLLFASFSFTIFCIFSIALPTLMLLWTLELKKCMQLPKTNTNCFQHLPPLFVLEFLANFIHFLPTHCLLINSWSSKLIWPITISLCVPCTTTWKHFVSSLWMNTTNFIFRLLHIFNLLTLVVFIPLHSPCTPFVDCAHLSTNCVNSYTNCDNTFVDYTNFFVDCANKSNDCANTLDDWANTSIDSADTLDNLFLDLCFSNPSLLKLLFTNF